MESTKGDTLPCPLYTNKIRLEDCDSCDERENCGLRLVVSRLNRLETRVRNLERGGPRP
jgi:hypothetical protein